MQNTIVDKVGQQFLDLYYKIQPIFNYGAKFHADRPTELGDLVLKIRKHLW